MVNYCDCGVDILVEISKHVGHASECESVISTRPEGPASEIDTDAPIILAICDSPYGIEYCMTIGGPAKRRRKIGIALDCSLQKIESLDGMIPLVSCNV